jgi:hypothetical protein
VLHFISGKKRSQFLVKKEKKKPAGCSALKVVIRRKLNFSFIDFLLIRVKSWYKRRSASGEERSVLTVLFLQHIKFKAGRNKMESPKVKDE